jgi:hypothetical protein
MTYNEAVNLGFEFCHSRGYQCQIQDARMAGNRVWKLKFNAIAPGARGHVSLAYNAYTRELLKVSEKVKAR